MGELRLPAGPRRLQAGVRRIMRGKSGLEPELAIVLQPAAKGPIVSFSDDLELDLCEPVRRVLRDQAREDPSWPCPATIQRSLECAGVLIRHRDRDPIWQ